MTATMTAGEVVIPWRTRLTCLRLHSSDVEAAVRDGGLVPVALASGLRNVLLTVPSARWSPSLVRAAVEAAQLDELLALGVEPFSLSEVEHNQPTYSGLNNMLRLLIGAAASSGGTNYANGTARLCVGDGNGSVPTPTYADTALAAPTNRYNQACDSTYPSVPNGGNNSASAVLTAQSTFPTGQANYEWREWGMDSGGSSGSGAASGLFNHRGVDLGLKTSAAAWALNVTITES